MSELGDYVWLAIGILWVVIQLFRRRGAAGKQPASRQPSRGASEGPAEGPPAEQPAQSFGSARTPALPRATPHRRFAGSRPGTFGAPSQQGYADRMTVPKDGKPPPPIVPR